MGKSIVFINGKLQKVDTDSALEILSLRGKLERAIYALKIARSKMHRLDFPSYGVNLDKVIEELEK